MVEFMSNTHDDESSNTDPLNSIEPGRSGGGVLGLQGRLTISFVLLLSIAMAGSCWLSATQSSEQMTNLVGEQARLIAYTLSMAAEPSMASGQSAQLDQIGKDLLNTRNVLFVAFLDADHKPLAVAKRYANFSWSDVAPIQPDVQALYVMHPPTSSVFGDYVDVYAPVTATPHSKIARSVAVHRTEPGKDPELGFVVVGVSLDHEQAQVQTVTWMIAGVGAVIVLISLPVVALLVFGIFKPIRQLVTATRKFSMGRMDFKVEIDRDDLIGELATSFQEMVAKIHRQREDLALGNRKLAEANTQLNRANQSLSGANTDLEQKVQQRTVQLEAANRRLSGEMAEKDDFLRAVSHDLNAPLRNIAGMAGMLLAKHREKFDEDIIHRLERIQKNVEVETDLISELLELSRIKSRRQVLEKIDPGMIVSDLAGVFEEDLRSRQIQLLLDNPLPFLNAEKARLRQVLQNLIDNAIKYMGDGRVREIHVGSISRADETEFYVRDTGIGIDKDDVAKVFSIFRRGKSSAVQNIPGKGVGLASVKSIIETYSGTIWVESELGKGTTFRFTINGKFVAGSPQAQAAAIQANDATQSSGIFDRSGSAHDRVAA
jgi:signal transduction histidine kinase